MARKSFPNRVSERTAMPTAMSTTKTSTTKYMLSSLPRWIGPRFKLGRVVGSPFEFALNIQLWV